MTAGARTPEELDTLFEDAFLLRDRASFAALFLDAALLVGAGGVEARGGEAIGRALGELWDRECSYVAGPRRVLRSRDTALVIGDGAIHVLHRDDGGWRAATSLLLRGGRHHDRGRRGRLRLRPSRRPPPLHLGAAGCRMLFILTPGGFENLVRSMSVPAQSRTLPPATDEEHDWDRVAAAATANGCELLG